MLVYRFLAAVLSLLAAPFAMAFHATQSGLFEADQYVTESRDPYFWDRVFRKVTPNRAPFHTLLAHSKQRSVSSQRFYHFSESVIAHVSKLTATISNSATTIPVSDGTQWVIGYTGLIVSTGEIFYVSDVSGNNLTVTRAFGGTGTAVTFTSSNDPEMEIWVLGNVSKEGSDAPVSHWKESENGWNTIMEHRKAWDLTTLAKLTTGLRGPAEQARMARMNMARFKEEQDRYAFFGKRAKQTISSDTYRMTGGLQEWIEADTTRVIDAKGTMPSHEFFEQIARVAFDNLDGAKSTLTVFCGPDVITALNNARLAVTRLKTSTTFGIKTLRYETNHGSLNFVLHRQLVGYYAGAMFILPMGDTRKARMAPISTDRNMQTPGQKTTKTGLYQPWGLDRGLAQHMLYVKNVGVNQQLVG